MIFNAKSGSLLVEKCRKELVRQLNKVEKNRFILNIPGHQNKKIIDKYPHFHLFPEVFLQISGITEMSLPAENISLRPGSITIVPRGMPHAETARPLGKPFLNIVIAFRQNAISFHLAEEKGNKPHVTLLEVFETPLTGRVNEYLEGIIDAAGSKGKSGKMITKGLLSGYLATLLNILEGKSKEWEKEHDKVTRCKKLIISNLSDNRLNVKKLAEWIGCAPDYLSYLFHKETNIRLIDYINCERVYSAQYLLATTESKIAAVGWACGYRDPAYFARIFKKISKKTPKEYRN